MAWIVEKTGEVRKGKKGEYIPNGNGDFIRIDAKETFNEYPILKVTEAAELVAFWKIVGRASDDMQRLINAGYRLFKPISPEPEYHWVDDWF